MLNIEKSKHHFFIVYILISSFFLVTAYHNQLFGDEAFYWLEGQWLSWSYSEVPGWTPWTLAVADWLWPQHPFFLRLPGLLAALSIPWLAMELSKLLGASKQAYWLTGLLVLALPLIGVAGNLAIPDIWIVWFTLMAMWLLVSAITKNQAKYFLLLGFTLALGINVHVRFWIIVLIACLVFMWLFRNHPSINKRLLLLTLPVMLIGFVPILIFNVQHEFPLLTFQFQDRHPWEFQASHFSFFLVQVLITTPLVFWLCCQPLFTQPDKPEQVNLTTGITLTATLHWLLFAILGFFSDTLRLNLHWTLVSYVLLVVAAGANSNIKYRFKSWAWLTGFAAHLTLMFTLFYWMHIQNPVSTTNARITNNSVGWQELAAKTDDLLSKESNQNLLVDHFMTLAQLQYYSNQATSIEVMTHPLNNKHGRDEQIKIMDLLYSEQEQSQLLVVEQSALKLAEQLAYYPMLCERLNGIKLVDTFDFKSGLKTYQYFHTQTGECHIPPIVYSESGADHVSGWVLENKSYPIEITAVTSLPSTVNHESLEISRTPLGKNELFNDISAKQYSLINFKIKINRPLHSMQLQMNWMGHDMLSHIAL